MTARTIIYSQEQMRSFDFVQAEHDILLAMAQTMQDVCSGQGTTVITGLAGTQTGSPSLTINIAAGAIYQAASADAAAAGAIPQDLTSIFQQGTAAAQTVTLSTSGISSGQSRWTLIQAQFQQIDQVRPSDPNGGVLLYFNAANPAQPLQGPGGLGATQNTMRNGALVLSQVNGVAATTGTETPPNPTGGWVPLYLIDLAFGQTQILTANILTAGPSVGTGVPSNYPNAPLLAGLLASHHGGTNGQAPKIKLASEVQGALPYGNMAALNHGQCILSLSAGNLLLSKKDGNNLIINGTPQVVPDAGVTLGPGGLAAPVGLSTIVITSNVLTVNTSASHGRASGDQAWVNTSNFGMVNGTVTVINATQFTIPFTHANQTSVADTGTTGALYYVYAFMNGATMTLEAVPIGHTNQAGSGVEVKSTDATRTLVGLAVTAAGPAFVTPLGVISWFNRRSKTSIVPFTSNQSITTASPAYSEVGPAFRNFFLQWGDEITMADATGSVSMSAGNAGANSSMGIDNSTAQDTFGGTFLPGASAGNPAVMNSLRINAGEGWHFAAALGGVTSGTTGTWTGNATAGQRFTTAVTIRG